MKHTFQQIFRSPNFVIGFAIFMAILLTVIVYPLIITDPPLEIIGQGTFFEPGIYVNVYDSIGSPHYTLNLDDAAAKRIASELRPKYRCRLWIHTFVDRFDTQSMRRFRCRAQRASPSPGATRTVCRDCRERPRRPSARTPRGIPSSRASGPAVHGRSAATSRLAGG